MRKLIILLPFTFNSYVIYATTFMAYGLSKSILRAQKLALSLIQQHHLLEKVMSIKLKNKFRNIDRNNDET